MPPRTCCLLIPLALYPPPGETAATLQRCEDSNGHITFTTLGCPHGTQSHAQRVHNPSPGSGPRPSSQPADKRENATPLQELIVVGEHDDGCGNQLDARSRRQAIIQQEVRPGMNRQEVESALGKPDRISMSNSTTRYHYNPKKGRSGLVQFDEKGCVAKR